MAEPVPINGDTAAAAAQQPIIPVGGGSAGPLPASSNAAPPQPAERMHLINEEQKFTPHLTDYLSKWSLLESGFGYNLCAVLGSQSTGKSTLLNRLFGTSFDVMDESRRQQTTKGELA